MITNHNSDKVLVVLTKYYGFIIDRISNSHFLLNHPDGRRITVPRHSRIKLGVIKSIVAQALTTQEEFLKHLWLILVVSLLFTTSNEIYKINWLIVLISNKDMPFYEQLPILQYPSRYVVEYMTFQPRYKTATVTGFYTIIHTHVGTTYHHHM